MLIREMDGEGPPWAHTRRLRVCREQIKSRRKPFSALFSASPGTREKRISLQLLLTQWRLVSTAV
jgi:hypothetical protein